MEKDYTSNIINFLRPFLLLFVIANHCMPSLSNAIISCGLTSTSIGGGKILIYSLIYNSFHIIITPAAVSSFFLISGFLFFYNISEWNYRTYRNKILKRVKSLLIPYIVWNVIGIICSLLVCMIEGCPLNTGVRELISQFWCSNTWDREAVNILGWSTMQYAPINWSLWYLRDLMVQCILTPLTFFLVSRLKRLYLLLLLFLFVLNIWISVPGFSIESFLFFGIGAYLSINNKTLEIISGRILKIITVVLSSVLTFVVTLLSLHANEFGISSVFTSIIWQIDTICLVILFFVIAGKCSNKVKFTSTILTSSFFIYAFHNTPVLKPIVITNRLLEYCPSSICWLYLLLTPFIVYAISLMVYCILKKIVPSCMVILNGGR